MHELKRLSGTWYANGKPCKDLPTPKKEIVILIIHQYAKNTIGDFYTKIFYIFFKKTIDINTNRCYYIYIINHVKNMKEKKENKQ